MVEGLERFGQHFADHVDQYLLIGGAACALAMDAAGRPFRVTKDLDIVLCVEYLDVAFAELFWEFVRGGEYKTQEKETGEKRFYRFKEPAGDGYPFMLELFSRVPDALALRAESHLTPIPFEAAVSSLSAILVEGSYYEFLLSGKQMSSGIPIVGPEHLIPLKAKAWLDLSQRKADGDHVDSRDIKKHKNDVFRLFAIIDPEFSAEIPPSIQSDLAAFLDHMEMEMISLENLGLKGQTRDDVLIELRSIYGIL